MWVDQLEVVPGEDSVVPGRWFGFGGVHDELGLGVFVEAAHGEGLLALLGGGLRLGQQQEGVQVEALWLLARTEAAALGQLSAPGGLDVPHAEQLEEGLRQRQVHQTVVLDTLGQEDAQEVEELGDALQLLAVLREGCREEAAGALHVEAGRLKTPTQVHLNTDAGQL